MDGTYAVRHILEQGLQTRKRELEVGVGGDGEAEEEDAGDDGADGHGAFPAHVLDVDGVGGDDGTRDADDGGDGVVAVGDVRGRRGVAAAGVGEVLGEEGVEEGVACVFAGSVDVRGGNGVDDGWDAYPCRSWSR